MILSTVAVNLEGLSAVCFAAPIRFVAAKQLAKWKELYQASGELESKEKWTKRSPNMKRRHRSTTASRNSAIGWADVSGLGPA